MNWWEKVGALFGVGTGSGAKESLHYSFSHETCLVWPRNLLPWLDLLSRTSVEVTKAGKYWREEMAHGIEAPHPPPHCVYHCFTLDKRLHPSEPQFLCLENTVWAIKRHYWETVWHQWQEHGSYGQ